MDKQKELENLYDKIEREILALIEDPIPGKVLEIPHIGKLELLPDREISYLIYRTGETQIWRLPDRIKQPV
jgi:dephospho-CoA kinase